MSECFHYINLVSEDSPIRLKNGGARTCWAMKVRDIELYAPLKGLIKRTSGAFRQRWDVLSAACMVR